MRAARACALLVLFAASATTATQTATATSWRLDPQRSQADFRPHPRVPLRAEGHFDGVSGELQSGGDGWQVTVRIDGRGLRFDGPTWVERLTRGENFLALDHYPDIVFLSEPFDPQLLRNGGRLRGQLSLRGRQLTVDFRLLPSDCARPGHDCDIQVRGAISRRAFGMTSHWLSVKDRVDFDFRVRLLPEASP
jgi:polyisoprenoid-binding protein YceI